MVRVDLSSKLIHLTRSVDDLTATARFEKILLERALLGSAKDIRGGFCVVAFTESPISMLASVLANAVTLGMRYAPLGFMVDKSWLFERGGRPVIYQPHDEFEELLESKKFLHVRFDPPRRVDYSWEREWRIKTDKLELDPSATTVIVPTREWEKNYQARHTSNAQRAGIISRGRLSIGPPAWHFVALEDLGVPFERMEPSAFEQFQQDFSIG